MLVINYREKGKDGRVNIFGILKRENENQWHRIKLRIQSSLLTSKYDLSLSASLELVSFCAETRKRSLWNGVHWLVGR